MVAIEAIETVNNKSKEGLTFKAGLTSGIPIAIGYIPIAIAFGLLAESTGMPSYATVLMSFIVFAGASQFVGVNLLALGAGYPEIILTTFILNSRHFLMSASLSQKVDQKASKKWLSLIAFGVTDETFMVASLRQEEKLSPSFLFGINLIAFSSWNIGTWIGVFLGAGLPASVQSSMGIALYVMFIGLLIPAIKKSRPYLLITIIAIIISSILHWIPLFSSLSSGWSIIITAILAALIGALLFPKEDV